MATTRKTRRASSPDPPVCRFTLDGKSCRKRGDHWCRPRALKAQSFIEELCVHTKGVWARRPFILEKWQREDIIYPVFGEVVWSEEWKMYIRRYRIVWIELARKQGKSELAAAIILYLLVGDDEEAAEIYGAARTTKQAGKVGEVVKRMAELSPVLSKRLIYNKQTRRLIDERTASYYEVITDDALDNLGHNPHGVAIDEVLAQASHDFWEAMETSHGTRPQPLLIGLTTPGNDPSSFCAVKSAEMAKIVEDPDRAPHVFVYQRNTPMDADPWDEKNWGHANPALGQFLSIRVLRDEAKAAQDDPTKENAFRQFRLAQWVSQVTRWMPLHLWDASAGMVDEAMLEGQPCFGGLDLASTTDLAAWVLLFPPTETRETFEVLWRFWTPEAQIRALDKFTNGNATAWARKGLLAVTEGDWIDYAGDEDLDGRSHNEITGVRDRLAIHPQIEADAKRFNLVKIGYDQWEAASTSQHLMKIGLDVEPVRQGFGMSHGLKEMMRLVKAGELHHGGHAVARWCADSAEVKQDDQERVKLVKPVRAGNGKRVDGIAALAMAIQTHTLWTDERVVLEGALGA